MPSRQRILISLLAAVGLIVGGDYGYRTWFAEPLADLQGQQEGARKRIQALKVEVAQAEKQAERLLELEQRSLPGDLAIARNAYQRWMLELVARTKLQNPQINASPPTNNKNLLYRMSFTLRASGSLAQVTEFLYEYYSTGYLQKITTLNVTPRSSGNTDLFLGVDVLILPQTIARSTPPPSANKLAYANLADYRWIAWKDVFGRGGFEKLARELELTGITLDASGEYEAWLSNRSDGETTILKQGDSFTTQLVTLEVQQIDGQQMQCVVDGQTIQLTIGDTVASVLRR